MERATGSETIYREPRRTLVARRVLTRVRLGPASGTLLAVALLFVLGLVSPEELGGALRQTWRPVFTIAAIMVMTAAADRLGVLERLAGELMPLAGRSTSRLLGVVFALSVGASAVLNNDAAILLVTPIVVLAAQRLYPDRPRVVAAFAFVVFVAAGVGPFLVSNPINMIVAEYVGLGFNAYARAMLPVALAVWIVTYAVFWLLHRREIAGSIPVVALERRSAWSGPQRRAVAVMIGALAAYPVVASFGGPIWIVAGAGALGMLWLCRRHAAVSPQRVVREGVAWGILVFLVGVSAIAVGIANAGVIDWLPGWFERTGAPGVGATSAVGSAMLNNHSMAILNVLALEETAGSGTKDVLAALAGGTLGPRLLPWGSLAGLLWLSVLRGLGVRITFRRFVWVGLVLTPPAMLVALLVLNYV